METEEIPLWIAIENLIYEDGLTKNYPNIDEE